MLHKHEWDGQEAIWLKCDEIAMSLIVTSKTRLYNIMANY